MVLKGESKRSRTGFEITKNSRTINHATILHEITINSQSCTTVRARFFVHDFNDFIEFSLEYIQFYQFF